MFVFLVFLTAEPVSGSQWAQRVSRHIHSANESNPGGSWHYSQSPSVFDLHGCCSIQQILISHIHKEALTPSWVPTHTHTILTAVDQSDVSGSSSSLVAGLAADGEQLRPQESHLTVHLVDLACDVVAEVSLDADFLRILH